MLDIRDILEQGGQSSVAETGVWRAAYPERIPVVVTMPYDPNIARARMIFFLLFDQGRALTKLWSAECSRR